MFDEQELKYLQDMETRILEQSAANMRVILESALQPQFNLLFEKLNAMEEKMIPEERIEDTEDRLDLLEAAVRINTREIAKLKKAQ